MSTTHSYDRESFLNEFFPDAEDRAEAEAGAQRLVNQSRAYRLAEMRRRLGLTQAEVAKRMHVRQERVSAIERAKVDVSELRTLAASSAPWAGAWKSSPTSAGNASSSVDLRAVHIGLRVRRSQWW